MPAVHQGTGVASDRDDSSYPWESLVFLIHWGPTKFLISLLGPREASSVDVVLGFLWAIHQMTRGF